MRIATTIGESLGAPVTPAEVVRQAARAEADGFAAAWSVHFTRGMDTLSVLAAAGPATSSISLGVGVVPTYPRHPMALAQQAATVQALCGGRLTLGVGVSHRPVIEDLLGLEYTSPAEHLRDYLSVLMPLVREGSVTHRGRFYAVDGAFAVPGTTPVCVVVGGLGPLMSRLAGELADGIVTWLAGPRSLETVVVPNLRAGAQAGGRPAPRVVAAVPVAVCDDVQAGRQGAATAFARYGALENYQRQLAREGASSPADLAVVGNEDDVARRLRDYADVGVTEVWASPFAVGADAAGSLERTRRFLVAASAGAL